MDSTSIVAFNRKVSVNDVTCSLEVGKTCKSKVEIKEKKVVETSKSTCAVATLSALLFYYRVVDG